MKLRVDNGTIVTPAGTFLADVLCDEGKIAALLAPGEAAAADERVDAAGKLVFPGFIDPHVHSRDPGLSHKEDFSHSTLGALCGGVTTLLEMPNAVPAVTDVATFRDRMAYHAERAWVDFGLWGMALGDANLDQIEGLFAEGAVAVKLFWGYALRRDTKTLVYNVGDEPPENLLLPPGNGGVYALFEEVARVGGVLAAHCEDQQLVASATERLGRPVTTYQDLLTVRSDLAEATSIAVAAQFSRATGCRFHVVHMASAAGCQVVRDARARGVPISAETCPQYLTLSDESYPQVGAVMKVYPPVRTPADQEALWAGIADGTVASIGSDHAPHTAEEKSRGFDTQPAGAVGVETLVPLMVDAMSRGRLRPERLAEVLSEQTARLYGLWPRKGALLPGADADLTIVDPAARRVIRNEKLHALHPVSPWNGVEVQGAPVASVVRGEVAMRDGEPAGERRGRFVPARHGIAEGFSAAAPPRR